MTRSASQLARALAELGVCGDVEARDRLAVLTLRDPRALADATVRLRALGVAREHGFTHLAVEVADRGDGRRAAAHPPGTNAAAAPPQTPCASSSPSTFRRTSAG